LIDPLIERIREGLNLLLTGFDFQLLRPGFSAGEADFLAGFFFGHPIPARRCARFRFKDFASGFYSHSLPVALYPLYHFPYISKTISITAGLRRSLRFFALAFVKDPGVAPFLLYTLNITHPQGNRKNF